MKTTDLLIIGSGTAGMAAALAAVDSGIKDILLIEQGDRPGASVYKEFQTGLGLNLFQQDMTGPELAERFSSYLEEEKIVCHTNTCALSLTPDRVATLSNPEEGTYEVKARAVLLAVGSARKEQDMDQSQCFNPMAQLPDPASERCPDLTLAKQAGLQICDTTNGPLISEDHQTSVSGIFACGDCLRTHTLPDSATFEGKEAGLRVAKYLNSLSDDACKNRFSEENANSFRVITAGNGIASVTPQYMNKRPASVSVDLLIQPDAPYEFSRIRVMDGNKELYNDRYHQLDENSRIRVTMPLQRLMMAGPELTVEIGPCEEESHAILEEGTNSMNLFCPQCSGECAIHISFQNNCWAVNGHSCERGREYAIERMTNHREHLSARLTTSDKTHWVSVRTDEPIRVEHLDECSEALLAVIPSGAEQPGDIMVDDLCGTGSKIVVTGVGCIA